MSHMRLWASAGIIALVILIAFAFSVPHTRDVKVEPLPAKTVSVPVVSLRDSFKKGLHTISGSIETPNACTAVSASASLVGSASTTQSILVAISTQADSGVCLQVPTLVNFKTTVSGPANLPITATVNGLTATTTPS